jgi:putative transcriptional regulator
MEPMRGRLLIASPSLEDPNFTRTVVLLLAHTHDGALGIVLNRPSPAAVDELLPQWHPYAVTPARVFRGGPVSVSSAFCLALPNTTSPAPVDGVDETVAGLVSIDLERDPDAVSAAITGLRVFSGYAGWGAGQLETELEIGGWILTDPAPNELITDEPDALWTHVLERLGGLRRTYVNAPPSLSMN